jgi:putative heme iron utilization protein
MPSTIHIEIARLVLTHRWAALATIDSDGPLGSMVAYAVEPELSGLLLYLSGLARHTRALLAEPRVSLAVGEPDPGSGDPQTLARVSLNGSAAPIPRDSPEFATAWDRYVARLPDAAPRLALGDFVLFRFSVVEARWVGGLARATTLSGDDLRAAAVELGRQS